MFKCPPWFANIPPVLCLIDRGSGRYYNVVPERRQDAMFNVAVANPAASSTTVLQNEDQNLRTCDVLTYLDTKIKFITTAAAVDGFSLVQIGDLYTAIVEVILNNDPFQTFRMTAEEIIAQDIMDGGITRQMAAGAFSAIPGVPSQWSCTPYYYPLNVLHRDNVTTNIIWPATGNLAGINFRALLLHKILRLSSAPQNNCGYTLAACDDRGIPLYEMIGERGPGLSVSSRIEHSGIVPAGLPAEMAASTPVA